MNRRRFSASVASSALAASAAAADAKPGLVELRYFYMRNTTDNQAGRTTEFVQKSLAPALERVGAGPVGFFGSVIAENSPFILVVRSFASLAAMEEANEKLSADASFRKAMEAYQSQPVGYARMETRLLRCFTGAPTVEVPAASPGGPRSFELRTYESNNLGSLAKKVGMFNNGEIAIFRKNGINPVFFGETLFGPRMPNLTYLVWYDDWNGRDKAWKAFLADAAWHKLRATPGLSDGEIVSNISNSLLRALPFSPIR
ncbi:MAG: NIPSNAP family containing protein [Acidobacteria bacterium]|nr:NIPSNAP family containing protein [Acidobacteriota bacterium]